jgi:hypothetical protein
MRTTIDIPDPIYRDLKSQAALQGRSVKELVLIRITRPADETIEQPGKIKFPAIPSKNPGSLKLGPEGVYEYIPFP